MGGLGERSDETERLLAMVEAGDHAAFERLFARHRNRLRKSIDLRLDPRLRSRFDASDVIQEAQVEAFRRINDYLSRRPMPFGLWLFKTAHQRLAHLRRHHLDAQRRSVTREVTFSEHSSLVIAKVLVDDQASLPGKLTRQEQAKSVADAIDQLDAHSREILLMRHVDGLTHPQIAEVLDISHEAVRKRYGRALIKLQQEMSRRGLDGTE